MSSHEHVTALCETPPTVTEQARFHAIGLETDDIGRPLHPWRESMPNLETGKGSYWNWGPNYTVDPVVITDEPHPRILLVRRCDNGKWALPGGFIDSDETAAVAARREVEEETGLVLTGDLVALCYQGPVHDDRSRLHAWSDTTAMLWRVPTADPVCGGDDAEDARWVPLVALGALGELHGSHITLIETAIREHGNLHEQFEYFGTDSELVEPRGGHMGYARVVATLPHGTRIFAKCHDDELFTDSMRAAHSRLYLRKEHHVYRELCGRSPYIPRHAELIEDHTLLLEAYDPRDGWYWRVPVDADQGQRYIRDVLTALRSVETCDYRSFGEIKPSYQTLVDEGWGSFSMQREAIIALLDTSSLDGAQTLADEVDDLASEASLLEMPALTSFAHYDIRQSNIAWHPEYGVKIVDWSWADHAPPGIDATSFLIDIAKGGHLIDRYLDAVDPRAALVLIGFWLGHSVWPMQGADRTVREHQLASAIAAHKLLRRLSK